MESTLVRHLSMAYVAVSINDGIKPLAFVTPTKGRRGKLAIIVPIWRDVARRGATWREVARDLARRGAKQNTEVGPMLSAT
jgi:hypothetical protein